MQGCDAKNTRADPFFIFVLTKKVICKPDKNENNNEKTRAGCGPEIKWEKAK
jgi:hypothetical protein